MDADQFRKAAHAAIEEIIAYHETLPQRRVVSDVEPGFLAPQLPTSAPEDPQEWPAIQADIDKLITPGLTNWQHPNFMAFFPAHVTYPSILGEMYSAAFNAPAFNWLCSPACTELETIMMDWLCKALGIGDEFLSKGKGGGVLQVSASDAIATVVVAARERALNLIADKARKNDQINGTAAAAAASQEDEAVFEKIKDGARGTLVALGSQHSHSSTQKGAQIAGTKYRSVPVYKEDDFAMKGKALRATIEQCIADGLVPYYLTVCFGTTLTCAVDDFAEIKEVLKDYPHIWVHVDASYAGSALILPEYQHLAKDMKHFDSFNVNMHKWMLVNFDATALFLTNRNDLISAMSITRSYLRTTYSDAGLVTDYRDWQFGLGRRFRSLKIWFVFRTYGLNGIRTILRNHIAFGETFAKRVASRSDLFTIVSGPRFALTVLTVNPRIPGKDEVVPANRFDPRHEALTGDFTPDAAGQSLQEANKVTREVYELVNSRGEIFLTSGVIDGVYAIRVVAATPRVTEAQLVRAFEILVETAEEVRGDAKK